MRKILEDIYKRQEEGTLTKEKERKMKFNIF